MINRFCFAFLGAASLLLGSASATAQRPDGPVIIAISDTLNIGDARAVVLRHSADPDRDMVIMKRNFASVELLGGALALLESRRATGKAVDEEVLAVSSVGSRPLPRGLKARLNAAIDKLERQPLGRIGALGEGRSVRLPSTRAN